VILAFDGVCVLCNGFVRFLLRRDRQGRLRFASSATEAGTAIFAGAGQDAHNPASVVLVDGEQCYFESEAIVRAVAALGGAWRIVSILYIVPRSLRDGAYRLVARNRYRWFGRLDTCPRPDPVWADRFVA
jgi:predicted DCC family thiol-disulfide oxidoreductase YuxK